jgi:hypothetical protein
LLKCSSCYQNLGKSHIPSLILNYVSNVDIRISEIKRIDHVQDLGEGLTSWPFVKGVGDYYTNCLSKDFESGSSLVLDSLKPHSSNNNSSSTDRESYLLLPLSTFHS